jgi:hypothetical protein
MSGVLMKSDLVFIDLEAAGLGQDYDTQLSYRKENESFQQSEHTLGAKCRGTATGKTDTTLPLCSSVLSPE